MNQESYKVKRESKKEAAAHTVGHHRHIKRTLGAKVYWVYARKWGEKLITLKDGGQRIEAYNPKEPKPQEGEYKITLLRKPSYKRKERRVQAKRDRNSYIQKMQDRSFANRSRR